MLGNHCPSIYGEVLMKISQVYLISLEMFETSASLLADVSISFSSSSDTCGLLGCDSPGNVLKPLVECRTCHRNFCFEHRNELDHKCSAKLAAGSIEVYTINLALMV